MKIINTKEKAQYSWAKNIIQKHQLKQLASLEVISGNVKCPKIKTACSTISCELCQSCSGIELDTSTLKEHVKCSYESMEKVNENNINKQASVETSKEEQTNLDDFKLFTSPKKDFSDKDVLSEHKIVSSKNVPNIENEKMRNVPKNTNSIFNSKKLEELEKQLIEKEAEKNEVLKKRVNEKKEKKEEWEKDKEKKIQEIKPPSSNLIRNISHDSGSNNPKLSEYKFSAFESIDETIKNIPEKTEGEKIKEKSSERKQTISREDKKDFSWESVKKAKSSTDIVNGFFSELLNKKEE